MPDYRLDSKVVHLDLTLMQGEVWDGIQFLADGIPVNLTGANARMQAKDVNSVLKFTIQTAGLSGLFGFTGVPDAVFNTLDATGTFSLTSSSDTSKLPAGVLNYDIFIFPASGAPYPLAYGTINIIPKQTATA